MVISLQSKVVEKLQKELDQAIPDGTKVPNFAAVKDLPTADGFILNSTNPSFSLRFYYQGFDSATLAGFPEQIVPRPAQ